MSGLSHSRNGEGRAEGDGGGNKHICFVLDSNDFRHLKIDMFKRDFEMGKV